MEIFNLSFSVLMRAVHILSAIVLLGGVLYARAIPQRDSFHAEYRRWIFWSGVLLTLSGLYNLLTKNTLPPNYISWFSVKLLLALHVIGVAFLLTRSSLEESKRRRLIGGTAISGVLVVVISAYLRLLSNWLQP